MHKFIYSQKDAWIAENSSSVNFGGDEVLELHKSFNSNVSGSYTNGVTRILTQFDLTEVSNSIVSGEITSPTYYLRLYSTEASELQHTYNLVAHPLSQSWEEGTGHRSDTPSVKDGVSWKYPDTRDENVEWTLSSLDDIGGGGNSTTGSRTLGSGSSATESGSQYGGSWYTGSGFTATQTFSYQSPDVRMDVTDIVNKWINGSTYNSSPLGYTEDNSDQDDIPNYGFILKASGSGADSEENDSSRMNLKFFSRNTNTIYPPKLEIAWDDHVSMDSDDNPGYLHNLEQLDMSGETDNYIYVKGIRPEYKETETVKFRVGGRKKYVGRTFSTSVQTLSGSYIGEKSGSYSIVDLTTGETIIPFSDYTYLSVDSSSMYFKQDMNTFQPDRFYKILIKVKYDDGQEVIYDNDSFQFKAVR
tara:strand:- start:2661 stop:3908 length:1248 start_codon:yes stop_codon:yes gene_type:complete